MRQNVSDCTYQKRRQTISILVDFMMKNSVFLMTTSTLPKSLSGIDRVSVSSQLQEMLKKENHALFHARFYRDSCTELEQRCRQLKNEKEGVRYFWQNKVTVLESQSRGDKILMMAKQSSTSTSVV